MVTSQHAGTRVNVKLFGQGAANGATVYGLLILGSVLPYLNTLFNGFVYDDNTQVLNNPYVRSFHHLPQIFLTNVWSFTGAEGVTNYYRPLMTLGYLFCYQYFGPLAYGFHLVNIVFHAAVVCALYKVTAKMYARGDMAFGAAILFALQPIHTESVAWIAAVTDLELTLFFLLAFGFYLSLGDGPAQRTALVQTGMAGSFVLAILSKEQALMLPVLATTYEHLYRGDRHETSWRQKLSRYGALWVLGFIYLLFRIIFLGAPAPVLQKPGLTWPQAFLSALALVGMYLWKLVWPVRLCAFYVFHKSASLIDPRALLGGAATVLCVAIFLVLWKRDRTASFGLVWFFVTIAPVLNARWMAANVFAERYLYLPSVGFCWAAAWGGLALWRRMELAGGPWRKVLAATAGAIALLCLGRIVTRNRVWRNNEALFTDTLAASPDAYLIRNNLGVVYWDRGEVKRAESEWLNSLAEAPQNPVILNNIGMVYTAQKHYERAVEIFRRAIRLKANYTDPRMNLGLAFAQMGRKDLAEREYRAAVDLSPLDYRARNLLGKIYLDSGRTAEAQNQFLLSAESVPNSFAYDKLGDLYAKQGVAENAERDFRASIALDAYDSHAHFALARIDEAKGRLRDALAEYQAGFLSDPTNRTALAAWGRLRAQLGNTGGQ